jgi:hypothetical protein
MSLNQLNNHLASYITRIHLALSFISREEVRNWKDRMHVWADDVLTPDNMDTWNQFIDQFKAKYADSQKPE